MNCYLLHVPRLPSQPASNMGGWVIDWNWLGLAWQSIEMTKNNLCIISISLLSKSIFLVKSLKIWSFETIQSFPMHVHVPPYIYKAKIACPKTDDKEVVFSEMQGGYYYLSNNRTCPLILFKEWIPSYPLIFM